MTTETNILEEKNPQLFYNLKIARIKKMYILLDKIKRAQLGTDKQSRVEYRIMEKNLIEEIKIEINHAKNIVEKHNVEHSVKDLLKNA